MQLALSRSKLKLKEKDLTLSGSLIKSQERSGFQKFCSRGRAKIFRKKSREVRESKKEEIIQTLNTFTFITWMKIPGLMRTF